MGDFFASRRVAVTGGAGFLGRVVLDKLRQRGCESPFVPRSSDYDLRTEDGVRRFLSDAKPELTSIPPTTVRPWRSRAKTFCIGRLSMFRVPF